MADKTEYFFKTVVDAVRSSDELMKTFKRNSGDINAAIKAMEKLRDVDEISDWMGEHSTAAIPSLAAAILAGWFVAWSTLDKDECLRLLRLGNEVGLAIGMAERRPGTN